jgi:hypothetical protein
MNWFAALAATLYGNESFGFVIGHTRHDAICADQAKIAFRFAKAHNRLRRAARRESIA